MSLSPNCSKYLWPHTFSRIVKLIRNVYSTFYLSETEPQSSACSLTTSSPPLLILLLLIPVFLFLLTTWRPRSVLAADLAPLLPWNGGGWILLRSTQCNLRSDSECHDAIYAKLSQKKKKKDPLPVKFQEEQYVLLRTGPQWLRAESLTVISPLRKS